MTTVHDSEADSLYVKLRDTEFAHGEELDDSRHILYDSAGEVLGLEFLYVSQGVDLDGIPISELEKVSALLQ